ncbi:hypothetical protein GW17_00019034 [Ensete ventricosum]|nr:hypothetical protein GW17_00019034 [Ensete ventricosum]
MGNFIFCFQYSLATILFLTPTNGWSNMEIHHFIAMWLVICHTCSSVAEIWGLLGLRLADDPVLPFDYPFYSAQLHVSTCFLSGMHCAYQSIPGTVPYRSDTGMPEHATALSALLAGGESVQVQPLNSSIDELTAAITEAVEESKCGGQLYSPPEDSESKLSFFPGIADAISQAGKHAGEEEQLGIQHEIWRVARAIQRAAAALRGELI